MSGHYFATGYNGGGHDNSSLPPAWPWGSSFLVGDSSFDDVQESDPWAGPWDDDSATDSDFSLDETGAEASDEEEDAKQVLRPRAGKRLPGTSQDAAGHDSGEEEAEEEREEDGGGRVEEVIVEEGEDGGEEISADADDEVDLDDAVVDRLRADALTPADKKALAWVIQKLFKHGIPDAWEKEEPVASALSVPAESSAVVDEDEAADATDDQAPAKSSPVPTAAAESVFATATATLTTKPPVAAGSNPLPPASTRCAVKGTSEVAQPSDARSPKGPRQEVAAKAGPAKKGKAWTEEEDRVGKEALWAAAEHDTTEGRFQTVADVLVEAGFDRNAIAVRNRARRSWRYQDGRDDRKPRADGKPRELVTSARKEKKEKMMSALVASSIEQGEEEGRKTGQEVGRERVTQAGAEKPQRRRSAASGQKRSRQETDFEDGEIEEVGRGSEAPAAKRVRAGREPADAVTAEESSTTSSAAVQPTGTAVAAVALPQAGSSATSRERMKRGRKHVSSEAARQTAINMFAHMNEHWWGERGR